MTAEIIVKASRTELLQAKAMIRRESIKTLKRAAFTCTTERLIWRLLQSPDSKWSELETFTVSAHVVDRVEKRLNLPTFTWDSHLLWAEESLYQWVSDRTTPDFPPFTSGSPYIVLKPDPSLPEAIADKEARVMAAAAIRAALEILEHINFHNLSVDTIEHLLGLSENEATHNLSELQKEILVNLRVKLDSLPSREKRKGWQEPWERLVEWNPWEEFTQIEWFKESTPSKRAVLSRSLQNLEDRGLIFRRAGKGMKKRARLKHTTYVLLTELGYLTAKMLT